MSRYFPKFPCVILFNPFLVNVPILHLLKTSEQLSFSGGIKWEYWPEIGSLINFHTQKKINLKRCLFTWMKTKTLQNKKTSKLTSDFFPCCLFSVCFPISVNKTWQLFLLSFLYCSGCNIFTTSLTTEVWKLISTW